MNKEKDHLEQKSSETTIDLSEREHIDYEERLATCHAELKKAEERYAYLSADFKNYRRQIEQERLRIVAVARKGIMLDLLSLIDNFERAEAMLPAHHHATDETLEQVRAGFELVHKAARKILETYNVRPIEQMEQFDPALHEAMLSVPADQGNEAQPAGTIIDILEKGYMLNGELLRPARVTIIASS